MGAIESEPAGSYDVRELEHVRVRDDDGVVTIELDRPPLNVLNIPMLAELRSVLAGLEGEEHVRVVVLRGAGKAFCAGVDVADHTADRLDTMLETFHGALLSIMALEAPVVCAVHGAALGGGCELAMACDLVLAHEDARFGQPEIRLGVFPPVAAALLPRLIGRQAAMDLILTGRVIGAGEARVLGLVHRTAPAAGFEGLVREYIDAFRTLSRPVVRLTKRAIRAGSDAPLEDVVRWEEELYRNKLMALRDPHEGLAAFMEKREPVWQHA